MNNKIDHLFNKLQKQQMAPPPAAWNKVQQQLNDKKQKRSFIYYKIASACLLISLSAITFKFLNTDGKQVINSDKEITEIIAKPQVVEKDVVKKDFSNPDKNQDPISSTEVEELKKPSLQLAENVPFNKENVSKTSVKLTKTAIKLQKNEIEKFEPEIEINSEILVAENKPEPAELAKENSGFSGITITYKRGKSVNDTTADLKVADKENTAVKKLIKIAKELKLSELNLADIRDSKTDLFSMEITKLKN